MSNPATSGINPVSYPGIHLAPDNYPSSSSGIPPYHPLNSVTIDPHQQALPAASSSSFAPAAHAPPGLCYNHCVIPNRKVPPLAMPHDRYYNMNIPCDHPLPKPPPSSHPWHWDPAHIPPAHDYGSSSHARGPNSDPRWCHNVLPHGPPGRSLPAGTWYGHGCPSTNSGVSSDEALHSSLQRPWPSHIRPAPCYPSPADEMRQAFSRHPRSLSISGGRGAERSVRSRVSCGRFQPYPTDESHRSRWAPPEVDLDFGAFDQHRDLRLDVDHMSYEVKYSLFLYLCLFLSHTCSFAQELLALGERIGSVSTGLSEETMAKCLKRTLCSDPASDLQIGSCVICLVRRAH